MRHEAEARAALAAWSMEDADLEPIEIGLINVTVDVRTTDDRYILQRLNPIFSPKVHEDIHAVTTHIGNKGLLTPRLVLTDDGAKWTVVDDGVWRLLTFIEGHTHQRLSDPAAARQAGALLGRFHCAVSDLEHTFENRRLGVHDTKKHIQTLRDAMRTYGDHRLHTQVVELGERIISGYEAMAPLPPTADRIVHGDPKISNIIFADDGHARCLVDLDTLAHMPVYLELGDAFRSWCNPAGEDAGAATFSLDLFRAAVGGYAEGSAGFLNADEVSAIVVATKTILLELAARFAADALAESYFGFDAHRFATLGDHNLLRATRQLEVSDALAAVEDDAEAIVAAAFTA